MAVKIRLRRMGAKKKPFYRIVVADSRAARDGRFIEQIGYFDPTMDPPKVSLDAEKAKLWLSRGAQPTDVVRSIISKIVGTEAAEKAETAPAPEEKPKRTRKKKEETAPAAEVEKAAEPEAVAEETKIAEPETAVEEADVVAEEAKAEEVSAEPETEQTPAEE